MSYIMDNGMDSERTHDTILTPDGEFISHEKPEPPRNENRAMIFPFVNIYCIHFFFDV